MMTLETFLNLIETQRTAGAERVVVPVFKRLSADLLTPVSAFLMLREPGTYPFLLESVEGGEKLARYSFLSQRPYRIVRSENGSVSVKDEPHAPSPPPGVNGTAPPASVYAVLQRLLNHYTEIKVPGLPRFTGGAVGFMGYDTVRSIERLPAPSPDGLDVPDAVWCFYDTMVAFDHVKHQLVLMASAFVAPDTDPAAAYADACARIAGLEDALSRRSFEPPEPVTLIQEEMESNVTRDAFTASVEKAKSYIYEGDIFQVVLSQRFAIPFSGDTFNLYRALRQVNPSPYLFYLDYGAFTLVGSSPEVLVRVDQGRAEVLPIAGTRPRGATPTEDEHLEHELLADPKERAEHLMLVDLGRNDLGRVCRFNTVEVDRYAYIERYSHVMHIVSSVSGRLIEKRGAMDVLAACFPAGTVSGAPKVRAMEIINELEPARRGVYAGAVGYVDFSGDMDTCIAIRTMVVLDRTIYVQAGAGIVADSDPDREFDETINKARALREAIRLAADGLL